MGEGADSLRKPPEGTDASYSFKSTFAQADGSRIFGVGRSTQNKRGIGSGGSPRSFRLSSIMFVTLLIFARSSSVVH